MSRWALDDIEILWPRLDDEAMREAATTIVEAGDRGESIRRIARRMAASATQQCYISWGMTLTHELGHGRGQLGVILYSSKEPEAILFSDIALPNFHGQVEQCVDMTYLTINRYASLSDPHEALGRLASLQGMLGRAIDHAADRMTRICRRLVAANDATAGLFSFDWVEQSIDLFRSGKKEESLDIIFDNLDDLLLSSKFSECDLSLSIMPVERLANAQLLTVLTATSAAPKDQIPSREVFYQRAKAVLELRGADADGLLVGLE